MTLIGSPGVGKTRLVQRVRGRARRDGDRRDRPLRGDRGGPDVPARRRGRAQRRRASTRATRRSRPRTSSAPSCPTTTPTASSVVERSARPRRPRAGGLGRGVVLGRPAPARGARAAAPPRRAARRRPLGPADVPRPHRAPRDVGPRGAGPRRRDGPPGAARDPPLAHRAQRGGDRGHRARPAAPRRTAARSSTGCSARPTCPPSLAERVLETTEGNPLFLGEMLRMLVDDGVLHARGDQWVVPERGRARRSSRRRSSALLAARIERLSDGERSVVERAAVIGQQFYAGAVAALGPARRRARASPSTSTGCAARSWSRPRARCGRARRSSASTTCSSATRPTARCSRRRAPSCTSASPTGCEERAGEHEELIALHLERAHAYRERARPARRGAAGRWPCARAAAAALRRVARARSARTCPPPRTCSLRALVPARGGRPGAPAACSPTSPRRSSRPATPPRPRRRSRSWRCAPRPRATSRCAALATALRVPARDPHRRRPRARDDRAGERGGRGARARRRHAASQAKAHHVVAQAHSLLGEIAAAEAALDRGARRRAGGERPPPRHRRPLRRAARRAVGPVADRARLGPLPRRRAHPAHDAGQPPRRGGGAALARPCSRRCAGGPTPRARSSRTCRATLEELGLDARAARARRPTPGSSSCWPATPPRPRRTCAAAQDGFAALGVESGAAQASALLARALVEQGRFHEAEEQTRHAERHAGEDLKTGIAWRGVRAEALARRGEHAEAERARARGGRRSPSRPTRWPTRPTRSWRSPPSCARAAREDEAREAATPRARAVRRQGATRSARCARGRRSGAGPLRRGTLGRRRATAARRHRGRARCGRPTPRRSTPRDWDGVRALVDRRRRRSSTTASSAGRSCAAPRRSSTRSARAPPSSPGATLWTSSAWSRRTTGAAAAGPARSPRARRERRRRRDRARRAPPASTTGASRASSCSTPTTRRRCARGPPSWRGPRGAGALAALRRARRAPATGTGCAAMFAEDYVFVDHRQIGLGGDRRRRRGHRRAPCRRRGRAA